MSRTPSQIDAKVSAHIRTRRRELGLTQGALGEELGLSYQQIQKYENGKSRISAGHLYLMSQALSVPIEYFFKGR